ncbi:SDR family NAD(P)-dependent oxidoreductase, partial [Rhizobium sp. BR5]
MQDRKDPLAVVTGAAGDIGRAIAAALAESHAKVVLVDIDPDALSTALSLLA